MRKIEKDIIKDTISITAAHLYKIRTSDMQVLSVANFTTEKFLLGRINTTLKVTQAVQRCYGHSSCFSLNRNCKRAPMYFVDIGNKECFAAILFVRFKLLRSVVIKDL